MGLEERSYVEIKREERGVFSIIRNYVMPAVVETTTIFSSERLSRRRVDLRFFQGPPSSSKVRAIPDNNLRDELC